MTFNRIGSSIERARTRRPVTWLTLIGVILLPVLVGGVLVVALYNPTERLDRMSAAIVNEDQAVQIDGKTVPLGRQLTAGLVKGSDAQPSNLDWTISNADDAASGLADGDYTAVITIPKNFSAAATSVSDGATAKQATIQVQTAPGARVVDDAITSTITQTAASLFGQALSQNYLENVFVGFTTLGTKLGDAANGAADLAAGAHSAADGAAQLPSGAAGIASGANGLASGLTTISGNTRDAASGATQIAAGLQQVSGSMTSTSAGTLGGGAAASVTYAGAAATSTASVAGSVGGLAQQLGDLAAQCTTAGGSTPFCADLAAAAASAGTTAGTAVTAATNAGYASAAAQGVQTGIGKTAAGVTSIAGSTSALGSGLGRLAGGVDQSAAGARQLGSGATQLSSGAQSLADGVAQLATGTDGLASGLKTAAASVPAYDDAGAKNLATVLSDPVKTPGIGTNLFGASAIPLLAMLALWFGALASFIALRAASARALVSRRSSVLLALRGFAPAAAIGVVQGMLVAGIVQIAASYDAGTWWVFAALCMVAGVAFAAVNQALVAVFGGAGRWVSAVIGVLAVAAGVVSTVPAALAAVAALLPTAPAYNGMVAALTSSAGVGSAIGGLLVWTVLAFVASTLAVARRRTTSARALLRSPAPVPA